ncbi:MAG: sigma-54-dependent Fis family transcriptional regulator [Candidatus Latescibacteria bacterium]|nr:sigma-54-dependent Fis family transcriptional regulator [Candidatus Latescibacterota bacterium]
MTAKHRMLVVDNDKAICWVLEKAFIEEGFIVDVAMDGKNALEMIDSIQYSLVIMDVMMPVMDGLTALKKINELPKHPETIIITAHSSMENTVEAMKLGAFDFVVKPFDIDELTALSYKAIEKYESRKKTVTVAEPDVTGRIIGDSPGMRELYKLLGRISPTDSSVLITGETGTGKDLFARAIHYHSGRRDNPFITVNCASIPGELLESELFGHVKGAFTGATGERKGKCELADNGTLFLDEIGTMRLDLQAKILTFLQRSEFEKVGSSKTVHVNVRVIAATNADLEKLVADKKFREDLYYRLMVVPMQIPSLRERREDIPKLAKYFVDRYNTRYGLKYIMTNEVLKSLENRDWPGNVRELENVIHRLVVLRSDGFVPEETRSFAVPERPEAESIESVVLGLLKKRPVNLLEIAYERIEEPLLVQIMYRVGDNQSEASKILGISRNTLRKLLKKHGLISEVE